MAEGYSSMPQRGHLRSPSSEYRSLWPHPWRRQTCRYPRSVEPSGAAEGWGSFPLRFSWTFFAKAWDALRGEEVPRMKALPKKNPRFDGASVTRITLLAVFAAAVVPSIWAARASSASAKSSGKQIEQVLRNAVEQKKVPGVVAIVSRGDEVIYEGALGKRDDAGNTPMTVDSIFRIASMTKPITSVAVMQLVESGRVKLDEAAATYLPELAEVQVLADFDANTGKAKLRPAKTR